LLLWRCTSVLLLLLRCAIMLLLLLGWCANVLLLLLLPGWCTSVLLLLLCTCCSSGRSLLPACLLLLLSLRRCALPLTCMDLLGL
jgi:hypothetical protein